MNFKDIKELILTIDKTSIQNVELEENDLKIKISKSASMEEKVYEVKEVKETKESKVEPVQKITESTQEDVDNIYIVKSPIVGVFYASPSPDSDAFVKIGDTVKKDQSLCIIEAMKIMNEIQSEESGEVIEILVENEDIVEYGQPLMKIRR